MQNQHNTWLDRLIFSCDPSQLNSYKLAKGYPTHADTSQCLFDLARKSPDNVAEIVQLHPDFELIEGVVLANQPEQEEKPASTTPATTQAAPTSMPYMGGFMGFSPFSSSPDQPNGHVLFNLVLMLLFVYLLMQIIKK